MKKILIIFATVMPLSTSFLLLGQFKYQNIHNKSEISLNWKKSIKGESLDDFLYYGNLKFSRDHVENWVVLFNPNKIKIRLRKDNWINYFQVLFTKFDNALLKYQVEISPIKSGEIKLALVNMISQVIENFFTKSNTWNEPWITNFFNYYRQIASYIVVNRAYITHYFSQTNNDFNYQISQSNYYFLDEEMKLTQDLNIKSTWDQFLSPYWFLIYKNENYDKFYSIKKESNDVLANYSYVRPNIYEYKISRITWQTFFQPVLKKYLKIQYDIDDWRTWMLLSLSTMFAGNVYHNFDSAYLEYGLTEYSAFIFSNMIIRDNENITSFFNNWSWKNYYEGEIDLNLSSLFMNNKMLNLYNKINQNFDRIRNFYLWFL